MSVVVEVGGELYSLLADGVGEVLSLDAAERAPNPPTLEEAWRQVSLGVHRQGDDLLVLLDVERPAIMFGLIRKASTLSVTVPVTPVRAVGVSLQPLTVLQRYSVAQAVPKAFSDSYLAVERTIQTIKGLVVGVLRKYR